jgi:uncharacterized protein YmfQ (DUF2313 family)
MRPSPQSLWEELFTLPRDRHMRRGQPEYFHVLHALLPRGIAWPRWPTTVLMRFVYGLAGIFGYCDGRAADLLVRESDPRSTVEMLDWWERAWGLPDPCWAGMRETIGERQRMLVMKMTMIGGQSRQWFINMARFIGYAIEISEYRPWMTGYDRVGDNRARVNGGLGRWPAQMGHPEMRFAWTVHIQRRRLVWFRVSRGQCGIDPHLKIDLALDLECLIRRWRPAHTEVLFDYSRLEGVSDPWAGTP